MTREEELLRYKTALSRVLRTIEQWRNDPTVDVLAMVENVVYEAFTTWPEFDQGSPSTSQTTPTSSEPQTAASEAINGGSVDPETIRYGIDRLKEFIELRRPPYELPADSFLEAAVIDILAKRA